MHNTGIRDQKNIKGNLTDFNEIELREVKGRKMLREFIYLPEKLHKGHRYWTPPIYSDECKYFNPKKNLSFGYSDTILVTAYKDNKPAGRIMGIINNRVNNLNNEKTARFAYLESIEDLDVSAALLNYVEQWALKHGMNKIVGPLGFTDQEPEGFLIDGFEYDTTIATYYNYPFIPCFLEKCGYRKEIDYFVYKIPVKIPDLYYKVSERLKNKDYRLLEFRKKKDIKPYIIPILSLMNETFKEIYGYTPLSMEEMVILAKQYFMLIDRRFLKVAVKDDKVIGFVLGMPNASEGLRRSGGHLFPFGIFHILRSMKKSKQLDLLLGGIDPKYQKIGIDVLMGTAMIKTAIENGFTLMDSHHELETNLKVRAEMERAGGEIYKTYRIYCKEL